MITDFSFVEDLCQQYREKRYFPSAVISIFDQEKTVYREAFGENQTPCGVMPVQTDTVFDVASLTKLATATQILLLIETGRFTLDSRIVEILPEIQERPALRERLETVTMKQLLTHSSGILDWYPFYTQKGRCFYDVFDSFIGSTELQKGTVYSDMNFMLLGKVLEKVKGKPLDQCLEEFRQQLGASCLEYLPSCRQNLAPSSFGNGIEEEMCRDRKLTFTGWRSQKEPVWGAVNDGNAYYFFDGVAGHAGIFADTDAYERLGRLYLTADSPLLRRSMTQQEPGRGLGWQIEPSLFPEGCGHTGFTGTSLWLCPSRGIGVVAFTNRLYFPDRPGSGTNEFRRALHQEILRRL